jgi:gamma-glutamylaminecyclotransferase
MQHRVFVYGTLKQGYPNFHINRGRRVPGDFITVQAFPLYVLGPMHLPWLVEQAGHGHAVRGQVFEVDDGSLALMDRLEQIDEPGWYQRRLIQVRPLQGGDAIDTFVYFGTPGRAAAETIHLGPLAEYTTAHALSYREQA